MRGKLYGVGVGPGDPELVTVRAARIIESASVIFYLAANGGQSLARTIAAPYITSKVEEVAIDMPMREDAGISAAVYDTCAAMISQRLEARQDVVMLCEGDPLFYGSFMYVLDRLSAQHLIEIVPGVTSLAASSAALARPLTRRNDTLKVLPATLSNDQLRAELASFSSIAIIKIGRHFGRLRNLLRDMQLLPHAMAIERASQADQRVFALTDEHINSTSYFTTIIIQNQGRP